MKYRNFGKHSFQCSEIGFGSWALGGAGWGGQKDEDSVAALHKALDLGCNFIDTAAGYGNGRSEKLIAEVLAERILAGKMEQVLVATKTPAKPGKWPQLLYCSADDRFPESYLRENVAVRKQNLNCETIDLLLLHTWTRAWNRNPKPLAILRELQAEGHIGLIGVSTPEIDQNCVVSLMRGGWVDAVEVMYNIFEQEAAAELLDVAGEYGVGVIVRVPFDEGVLTGKFTTETKFAADDFRSVYFAGDRLGRAIEHTKRVEQEIEGSGYTLPQIALKFCLSHPAVSTVIPGMRNAFQAEANCSVSDLPDPSPELIERLKYHCWHRSVWYSGK